MAAILGLDDDQIIAICERAAADEVVSAVNFNSPGQVVIAGDAGAVQRAVELAKQAGAKRALPLPVSVPSHCALMRPAADRFAQDIASVALQAPRIPVLHNVDVAPHQSPEAIRDALVRQLYNPVRWVETVRAMHASGVTTVLEMGPGKVLAGLNKRIEKSMAAIPVQKPDDLEQALYASKIVSYAQGYQLMRAVSTEQDWALDYGAVALMWREGCIIRSRFLENIRDAFGNDPELANLMLDDFFRAAIDRAQAAWRRVVAAAAQLGVPMPAIGSALAYYDAYRAERLPANLLQAQRDYFGAHTYERVDRPRGEFFHTDWTGHGGDVTARTYQA